MLVNIFIAILSSTFDRVYSSARAYFLLLRAQRIINNEHSSQSKRLRHLIRIANKPEVSSTSFVIQESKEDYIEQVNKLIMKDRDELAKINQKYEDYREKFVSLLPFPFPYFPSLQVSISFLFQREFNRRFDQGPDRSPLNVVRQRISSPAPRLNGPSKEEVEKLSRDLRKLKSAIAKTINEF